MGISRISSIAKNVSKIALSKKAISKSTSNKTSIGSKIHTPRKSLSKTKRTELWNHRIGAHIGKNICPICETRTIYQRNFEAGHIIPASKNGSDDITNLKPICGNCNRSMSNKNLHTYKTLVRPVINSCVSIPFIDENIKSIIWLRRYGEEVGEIKCPCCNNNKIQQIDFYLQKNKNRTYQTIPVCKECSKKTLQVQNIETSIFSVLGRLFRNVI